MTIPPTRSEGDSGHIQDHNNISSELSARLPLSGGTLTGTLNGTDASFTGNVSASDPTSNSHLATKLYVDNASASASVSRSINEQSTNYTLISDDEENIVTLTTAATVTIPAESSVDFSPAAKITLLQSGGNTISVDSASGVEIVNRGDFGTTTSGEWKELELLKIGSDLWAVLGDFNVSAGRALFAGGFITNTIEYITMSTSGNATDFGDLYGQVWGLSSGASSTRAVFSGGTDNANNYYSNIGYVTIATTGNSTSFGNMTSARYGAAGLSSDTRAIFISGINTGPTPLTSMEYVTIATTGNGSNFGNASEVRTQFSTAASPTRGIFAGGGYTGVLSSIEYITIATTGNSAAFGNLGTASFGPASGSSNTRALFQLGAQATSTIEYVTIATLGNAQDFGDTVYPAQYSMGTASRTGVYLGGSNDTPQNKIQRVSISTLGNATEFGNLTVARGWGAAASNAHGGIPA